MVATCGTCWKEFPAGFRSRDQHMNATGHRQPDFECNVCDRYFGSQTAVNQHMNARNHWGNQQYACDDCSDTFSEEDALRDHEVTDHYYCDPCNRYFRNQNNIRMHLNSKAHRGGSLACPFCGKACTTATGMVHHLERGSCPNAPLDRTKLYEAVRQRDPNGALTKHLLEWHATDYEATENAYNYDKQTY